MSGSIGRISRFVMEHVHFIPTELKAGVLYVSQEFGAAAHLCACGCGSKVRTPLGPASWSIEETRKGPTLDPSVGNWQKPCRAHYWIIRGEVIWAEDWTPEQIAAGRRHEEQQRRFHYEALGRRRGSILQKLWRWLKSLFAR